MNFSDNAEAGEAGEVVGASDLENSSSTLTGGPTPSGRCGLMDQYYMAVWFTFQWWCEGVLFTGIGKGICLVSYSEKNICLFYLDQQIPESDARATIYSWCT